jgi:hypothetical protein
VRPGERRLRSTPTDAGAGDASLGRCRGSGAPRRRAGGGLLPSRRRAQRFPKGPVLFSPNTELLPSFLAGSRRSENCLDPAASTISGYACVSGSRASAAVFEISGL